MKSFSPPQKNDGDVEIKWIYSIVATTTTTEKFNLEKSIKKKKEESNRLNLI